MKRSPADVSGSAEFRVCVLIPFYRHERAIAGLIDTLRPVGLPCFLIDDGSGPASQPTLEQLAKNESRWMTLVRIARNGGKGEAMRVGFFRAIDEGFTHAVQIDADHQHDPADIPAMLDLARLNPTHLVTGLPVYDDDVPRARLYGRYVTHFWVWVHTLSCSIRDSMCGFRVYPLAAACACFANHDVGRRMQFDTDIMVKMFWDGTPVVGMPTRVRYPADGVSHFRLWSDNLRISWMHTQLFFGMIRRLPRLLARHFNLRK